MMTLSAQGSILKYENLKQIIMDTLKKLEVWFVTGSQDLYGPEVLKTVGKHSQEMAAFFNKSAKIPVKVVYKSVMRSLDEVTGVCVEANTAQQCIGIITWCHTFSPSKMWINGLKILNKPLLQLHTQYNRDLPWGEIDMDFMNLNQAAHGDREHGFILSRLRKNRKVVVGYWKEDDVQERIGVWTRAAAAWYKQSFR
jgi:L-arabinose isomerase